MVVDDGMEQPVAIDGGGGGGGGRVSCHIMMIESHNRSGLECYK